MDAEGEREWKTTEEETRSSSPSYFNINVPRMKRIRKEYFYYINVEVHTISKKPES